MMDTIEQQHDETEPGRLAEPQRSSILVIDDSPDNLTLMRGVLGADYLVKVAINGHKGLSIARSDDPPDLILLDVMMPGIDGFEVIRQLKADLTTRDIPVIFLTARVAVQDEAMGFELGAVDYITKPISPSIVRARVATHLGRKAMENFLRDKSEFLETQVGLRARELLNMRDRPDDHLALSGLVERRVREPGNHVRRTQQYMAALTMQLRNNPRFSDFLTQRNIIMLCKSAPLHDIGHIGIPDRVLLKPGVLTDEEYAIMKTHTDIGRDAVEDVQADVEHPADFLEFAKEIAFSHQERWDGSGYPLGLSGEDIPIPARLMAVADVYDSLTSHRLHRKAYTHEQAVSIIAEGHGRLFDPDIVDAFVNGQDEFRVIAERYADRTPGTSPDAAQA